MDDLRNATDICVGLDIGYGNLKVVGYAPESRETARITLPVGAAPASQASKSMSSGQVDVGSGALVEVDGLPWVAGVSPLDLQDFARPTHVDYPRTREYMALFFAALSKLGAESVKALVIGLPVNQFYEGKSNGRVEELRKRLTGSHYYAKGKSATVENVIVVPQPAGAYTDIIQSNPNMAKDPDWLTLVVDVGYFSTDWVLVRRGKVQESSSGSSTDATSRIIEAASRQITLSHHGLTVSPARLESAIRNNRDLLRIGDHEIDYKAYIGAASQEVGSRIISKINSSLRNQSDTIDMVAITGGGGAFVERAFKQAFPSSSVATSTDPVMANANGFCLIARKVASKG